MLYCPQNISLGEPWIQHGLSHCFMETVSSSIIAGFIVLFGTIQIWMYRKYGTQISPHNLPFSRLYYLQIIVTVLLLLSTTVRFILQCTYLYDKTVYGYMILSATFIVVMYSFSLVLIILERNYLLPSVPPSGHGIILLLFWTLVFITENLTFLNLQQKSWWFFMNNVSDKIEMGFFILRYVCCLLIFILGLKAPGIPKAGDYEFVRNDQGEGNNVIRTGEGSTFKNVWKKLKVLFPYLWPKKDFFLELRVIVCILLLVGGRVINLFVPIYSKMIVDSMTGASPVFRWDLVLILIGLKFLQGGGTGSMGVLNNLRSFLWISVQQYTTREIKLKMFKHLHDLSLRWHICRKTGEVLRVMDRGTDSVENLLNYILFNIVPTITDIVVAIVFFVSAFNGWFGLIVFITMTLYLVSTILVTEWRTKYQRAMNLADNAQQARSVDSLLNFETVKYYGAEDYEVQCYKEAVLDFQEKEWKATVTLNILNTLQNFIVCCGLLSGSMLCVFMVVRQHTLSVGDYVLFSSYIIQLYVPLNWFGTYYRAIQRNFVDMENMFDLMQEDQEVIDAPGAGALHVEKGKIEFRNVNFSYIPEKIVLQNINFIIPPGKTAALVGPSGSGKSTIVRLLFRFYDVDPGGGIFIDDQNVKTVSQSSLRKAIGVVPQDTVLFNNTIKFNIRYGRVSANDVEVIEAAKYADIHEQILTFPQGYDTQVGERGLKLSGGEKQRVAIARTILKSPVIILLDEATSALDTQTERNIQSALMKVCTNRTSLIVAHRLSTIIHADEIFVLNEGKIVEKGRHEDLVNQGGMYASMWQQQLKSQTTDAEPSDPVV